MELWLHIEKPQNQKTSPLKDNVRSGTHPRPETEARGEVHRIPVVIVETQGQKWIKNQDLYGIQKLLINYVNFEKKGRSTV